MSGLKVIEQSSRGKAVVVPARQIGSEHNAPRPHARRVTALLSDHHIATRGPAIRPRLSIRSGHATAHARPGYETRSIELEDALELAIHVATPDKPAVAARLVDPATVLDEPCYVALFPGAAPSDLDALSVVDGRLRSHGCSIDELDYALVRVTGTHRPDLTALDDLDQLRQRLLAQYRTGDREQIERALQAMLAAIEGHPGLLDADRRRLRSTLLDEHRAHNSPQSVAAKPGEPAREPDWAELVATLPADKPARHGLSDDARNLVWDRDEPPSAANGPAAACGSETPATVNESATKPVYWNTRLLDGERPLAELFVTVGTTYTIENRLDPAMLAGALVTSNIAPSGLPDGTQITFEVSCPQPILRLHGSPQGLTARVSATGTYRAGCCPPVCFDLVPAARGRIPLTLGLVTDNAIRASAVLTLQAEPAATLAAAVPPAATSVAPEPAHPAVQQIQLVPAAMIGHCHLRLVLTETQQIVVGGGPLSDKPRDPKSRWDALTSAAIRARKRLVELSGMYRVDRTQTSEFAILDAPTMCLEMAKVGADLHQQFFGTPHDPKTDDDIKRLAKAIAETPEANHAARLQIYAAYQPFPWAVFYDGAYRGRPLAKDPASVDLSCFWGHRFRIDRAIMGHFRRPHAPVISAPVTVRACFNSYLDKEPAAKQLGVAVLEKQEKLFENIPGVTQLLPQIKSKDEFIKYLNSNPRCDLLYVLCHATAAATRDDAFVYSDQAPDTQAKLIFEPSPPEPLDVATMQSEQQGPLSGAPFVFLNACGSAAGDEVFQPPLLEQFLDGWGVAGVLGTDWEIPTAFADVFARRLVDHFLRAREPLGEAFWRTSQEAFAQGNPFPLVYALYAEPNLTIVQPPARKPEP